MALQSGAVSEYSNSRADCQPNLIEWVYRESRSLLQKVFPATCLLCLDPGQDPALDLCCGCEADLPRVANACPGCGMPLAESGASCSACRQRPHAFDAAFAPYRYEFPLVELIHRLKYGDQIAIARILGTLLARRLAERKAPRIDAILPVPLAPRREALRGYNQAREIAAFAADRIGLPVADRLARRIRDTEEQAALPAIARAANVSGAFEVMGLPPPRLAIVDDVLTTGATADALALALKRAGCRYIEVWAVARAAGGAAAG